MSKAIIYLATMAAGCTALIVLQLWSVQAAERYRRDILPQGTALVRALGLTDLSIWTEARYTRHPSQADLFTPFQDHPSALEHFPAGSVLAPPPGIKLLPPGSPARND